MSDYIPPEVVAEILTRLLVKSLLRFRCVCKQWLSLISNPNFISQHLCLSSHSPTHTLIRRYSKLYSKEIYTLHTDTPDSPFGGETARIGFPFHEKKAGHYTRVVGYCNGILCLSDDMFGYRETLTLWNPSIERALTAPTPKVTFDRYGSYMSAIGFGFDPKTNDYKVVRVCYLLPTGQKSYQLPPKVEVFTVLSGKWTSLELKVLSKVKTYITENFWSQAVVEGMVHWNGYKMVQNNLGERPFSSAIMKFDLEKEVFGELDLPQALAQAPPMCISSTILRGSLSVLCYNGLMLGVTSCAIWVMNDYGVVNSWTEKYKVNLDGGLGMVLGMRRDGQIALTAKNGELVSYNCESERVTSTGIFGSKYSFFVDDYRESLVLLGKGKLVQGKKVEKDYEDENEKIEDEENLRQKVNLAILATMLLQV